MYFKNYREESRKNWGSEQEANLSKEQIQTGCMLRIADSLERIEKPYLQLLSELEYYKRRYDEHTEKIKRLQGTNAALKSWITRIKNNYDLGIYLIKQKQWSLKTFGNAKRTVGIIKHIKKELLEIRKQPDDLIEWIDVIILGMDGYWRHGGEPMKIMDVLLSKQNINFKRKYPFPNSEDEPSEHIR